MPLGNFVESGTIPRPLVIGRLGRLAFGIGCLAFLAWLIINRDDFVGRAVPMLGWWFGVGAAFWYFSDMIVVGLTRAWGRWPQAAALVSGLALLVADLAVYGTVWAPPLGWGVLLFAAAFYVSLGVSFLIASTLAVPG